MKDEILYQETLNTLREAFPEIDEDLLPYLMEDGLEL